MCAENILSSKDEGRGGWRGAAAWLVAVLSALIYAGRFSPEIDPDLSATILAHALHLVPFPSMEYPVWSWLIRGISELAGSDFPRALNVFSALCGAGALTMLFFVVQASFRDSDAYRAAPALPLVSGLAAAGFLAVCIPFWMVSNRAHPASFDALLLLGSIGLLQRYAHTGRTIWLYAFAGVYGVGVAELATFALFLPAIGLFAIFLMWRNRQLRPQPLALALLCGCAGSLLLLAAAVEYFRLPTAAWREAKTVWDILKYHLLERRALILSSIPRHGWLLLFMGSLLPWALGWAAQRRNRGGQLSPSVLLLYLVLLAITLAVLFNGPIAPWRVLGLRPLLVTPYVLVAATFGFLLARIGALLAVRMARIKRSARWVPLVLLALALVPLVAAGVRHAPLTATRADRDAAALVRAIYDMGEGRPLWMGDGLFELQLRLEARRRGHPFEYVNLPQTELSTYRRYLASLFSEPRLQSLAYAGLGPLLSAWLGDSDDPEQRLAIELKPDIWLAMGWEPVPMGLVFLGCRERTCRDPMEVWARNQQFWDTVTPLCERLARTNAVSQWPIDRLQRQLARMANDLGVYLENTGHPREAAQAYQRSLAFDEENLSAALNLLVLAGELDESIDTSLAASLRDRELAKPFSRPLILLAMMYGHLRTRAAADLLARGEGLVAGGGNDPVWTAIQRLIQQGQYQEARRQVDSALLAHPDAPQGWLLLAGIGYDLGQPDLIDRGLRQMQLLGQEWPQLLEMAGRMQLRNGEPAKARELLLRALARRPGDPTLLRLLLQIDLAVANWSGVERWINQILVNEPNDEEANFALAAVLRERKRYDLAEAQLQHLARGRRTPRVLAELAEVQRLRGALEDALASANEAVQREPRYARAREVRGRVLLDLKRIEEAGADIQEARLLNPDSFSIAAALVDWQLRVGDVDAAKALAQETLDSSVRRTADEEKALRERIGR